jgi:hypothetical protein
MKTRAIPLEDSRNRSVPSCDRCHRQPGEYRWTAASRAAEKVLAELRLCHDCLDPLNSFLLAYDNKIRQKAEAAMQKSKGCP